MTLKEHLNQLGDTPLSINPLPSGNAATIKDFFDTFVAARFPHPDVVRAWHKALMEYTDDANLSALSCCVRFGNNGGKKESMWHEKGYYKLRRGWTTKNVGDDFEYFFADNAFPAFIYRLALDGVAPSGADELRALFKNHEFPYCFGFFVDKSVNEYKGVTVATGKNPGFLGNYKLSHVFDAGEFFNIHGRKMGDAELSDRYYPIGHSDDFLKQPDRIRRMDISDEAKRVIRAKFLRFAHPFNYFLTPTKKRHVCGQKVYKKDIGEDPRMIRYIIQQYLEKTYPTEYKEFLSRIMWYEEPAAVAVDGSERIDITYGLDVNAKGVSIPAPVSPKNSGKNDYSQFVLDGNKYGKGRLALAVVQKYVAANHPADFAALQQVFPDALQGSWGVVRRSDDIQTKHKSPGRDRRYYVKSSEIIHVGGEEVLVSDQYTLDAITRFIQHVNTALGYGIVKA